MSPVYYPNEKIKRPNTLITNDRSMDNVGEKYRGADKFEYLISPKRGYKNKNNDFVEQTSKGNKFKGFVVYKSVNKKNKVESNIVSTLDVIKIKSEANYALVQELTNFFGFKFNNIYMTINQEKRFQVLLIFLRLKITTACKFIGTYLICQVVIIISENFIQEI